MSAGEVADQERELSALNGGVAVETPYEPSDEIGEVLSPFARDLAPRPTLRHLTTELLAGAIAPLGRLLCTPPVMRRMPYVPSTRWLFRGRNEPPRGRWTIAVPPVPEELLSVPGIRREPAAEQEAFLREPLQHFFRVHHEAILFTYKGIWRSLVPVAPRLTRGVRATARTHRAAPAARRAAPDTSELTRALKARSEELGLSAVGITGYDPKYTFVDCEEQGGDNVVVVALEQDWEATQTTPSIRSDKAALITYAEVMELAARLAGFLLERGYRARTHNFQGEAVVLHYGVEAGLGQMGLNGQLLTPAAGSRCRLTMITTDAPLEHDQPVDYGISGICDRCQACVQRCPSGAIPATRRMYRGVEKAKLNVGRCFPVVAQAHACAICMKVCPIQRYGLPAVLEEYARTGRIKGKGTDELEGYDWPLDGRHYGPGERPRLAREFFDPPEMRFDPRRKLPLASLEQTARDFA